MSLARARLCKVPPFGCQTALVTSEIVLESTSKRKNRLLRRKPGCESSDRKSLTSKLVLKWHKLSSKSRNGWWSPSFFACWLSLQPWSPVLWLRSMWWRGSRASASLQGCWCFGSAPAAELLDSLPLEEPVTLPTSCGALSKQHGRSCNDIRTRESI